MTINLTPGQRKTLVRAQESETKLLVKEGAKRGLEIGYEQGYRDGWLAALAFMDQKVDEIFFDRSYAGLIKHLFRRKSSHG